MVPNVETAEGGEVREKIKVMVLQAFEVALKKDKVWVEEGQRISVTKERRKEGPLWRVTCPQGGQVDMLLYRWKGHNRGKRRLFEGIFEGGHLRMEEWWCKGVEEEVWKKGGECTMKLDKDKALVLEHQRNLTVVGLGEMVWRLGLRTRRVEV